MHPYTWFDSSILQFYVYIVLLLQRAKYKFIYRQIYMKVKYEQITGAEN